MTQAPWFSRVVPFALYMLFILIHDLLKQVLPADSALSQHLITITYPLRTVVVLGALWWFRKEYDELQWEKGGGPVMRPMLEAIGMGLLVFVLWIQMDWGWATMGDGGEAYDPRKLPPAGYWAFIAVRIFGASVVVAVFEELFWRSFIIRYIINPDFTKVAIGAFTWTSFLISAALFGAEHHLWLAGIMAGLLYNLLLYRTRHLFYLVLAHGITNFCLGIYVVTTGSWRFW